MVSGPEPEREAATSHRPSNQRESEPPSERELGALFEAAMKAQEETGGGKGNEKGKGITPDEQQKFLAAMKDPEFRSLLNDYMQEISDPQHRAETEQYLSQLESEQRVPEDKELVKPAPGFVVKTRWKEPSTEDKKMFVNICSSGKLQPPSSTKVEASAGSQAGTSWNLPYSVGPERLEGDKGGAQVATFDVCFHTRTLELSRMNAPFREMVVKVGLDAVEGLLRESRKAPTGELSRTFHIIKGVSYKSGDPVTMCLRKPVDSTNKSNSKPADAKKTASVKASTKPTKSSGTKAPQKTKVIDVVTPNPGATAPNVLDVQAEKAEPIMKEVSTTKNSSTTSASRDRKLRFQMIYRGKFELMHHMQAEHDNIVPADRNRPKELVVEIEIPDATSAKGIDLDVSETMVRVSAQMYEPLSIPLPYPVIEAKGAAKFDKKKHNLVVTLPVKAPSPPSPKAASRTVEENEDEGEEEETLDATSNDEVSEPISSTAAPTSVPFVEDEFRMFREIAVMVANDPQILARKSQAAAKEESPSTIHDDMPPLEACSDEEDDVNPDPVSSEVRPSVEKDLDGAETSSLKPVNIPAFSVKETSACVSYLVAVPGIDSPSVKLCFPSASSMKLSFTADSKEYELDIERVPRPVRPETAEFDVATENMVVIVNKLEEPSSTAPSTAAGTPPAPMSTESFDPVIRFQNDLLYELD